MKVKFILVAVLVAFVSSMPFALQAQSTTGTSSTTPTKPPTGKPTGPPPTGAPKGPPPHRPKK